MRSVVLLLAACLAACAFSSASFGVSPTTFRIDHVTDGDTVVLRNGQKVRLVQIDTPEVSFGTECYGPQASATTKRLLSVGTRVRLTPEPATIALTTSVASCAMSSGRATA
jgi:endonuclease YncB( thermonuclease family)